jgi:glycosyltransferase involved in cell wall biosynthesis
VSTNPVGKVHRHVVEALCDDIDFVVFAVRFDNPCPDRVRWARVPALRRPLVLLFLTFHLSVALRYLWERVIRRARFDAVQSIESASILGGIVHAQFCHRWFLRHQWRASRPSGARGVVRGVFERLAAAAEPLVFSRARSVVAPSQGAARALVETFPALGERIRIAYNGIDLPGHRRPDDLEVDDVRRRLGLPTGRPLLVFVSLGHFERKGLPLVLAAMGRLTEVDLVVVGGTEQALAPYRRQVSTGGLAGRVHFAGFSDDVRPYLWAADGFVLPSSFEGFPFVALEAAAAGLPLLVTPVNGVEEILVDGVTGYLLERDVGGVTSGIARFLASTPGEWREMGDRSRASVERFSLESMVSGWRAVYAEVIGQPGGAPRSAVRGGITAGHPDEAGFHADEHDDDESTTTRAASTTAGNRAART